MKKYKLTDETKELKYRGNKVLHRIQALKDFTYSINSFTKKVKAGDLGGFIESEENLSQYGSAWVEYDSMVYGNAHIIENAVVTRFSEVWGSAIISGNAIVGSWSRASDNAVIKDNAEIRHSSISGNAVISDKVNISDGSDICHNAVISGNARIESSRISGNAIIKDNASVYCNCSIFGNAVISDIADIFCGASICGNANITKRKDWLHIVGIGGFDSGVTFFRNANNGISVSTAASIYEGMRSSIDTINDFLKFIDNSPKDEESENYHIYKAAAEIAKLQIGLK